MIRVALIDDHALVRVGLRLLLEREAGIEVVGEAADGETGWVLLRRSRVDVALVDLHMPGMSGVELALRAHKAGMPVRLIALSVAAEAPFPRRLLEAGAYGYLTKGCSGAELVQAVRQVAEGRRYIAAAIAQGLALDSIRGVQTSPFELLTPRELEIALHFARGADAQSIAGLLWISEKTVATHKARVMAKLGIGSEVALAHLATHYGLIDPAGPVLQRRPRRPR